MQGKKLLINKADLVVCLLMSEFVNVITGSDLKGVKFADIVWTEPKVEGDNQVLRERE